MAGVALALFTPQSLLLSGTSCNAAAILLRQLPLLLVLLLRA